MYCKYCGHQAGENAYVCTQCGAKLHEEPIVEPAKPVDSGSAWWGVLGAFFPTVGLILFLCWKDSMPKSAKSVGIGALVGVGVELFSMLASIIFSVLFPALFSLLIPLFVYEEMAMSTMLFLI